MVSKLAYLGNTASMADPNFAIPCYYYQTCPPAIMPPPYAFHPFQPPDYSPPILPPYLYHQPQPPPHTPPTSFTPYTPQPPSYYTPPTSYTSPYLSDSSGIPWYSTNQHEIQARPNPYHPPSNCFTSPFITTTQFPFGVIDEQQPELVVSQVFDESPHSPELIFNSSNDNCHQMYDKFTEIIQKLEEIGKNLADQSRISKEMSSKKVSQSSHTLTHVPIVSNLDKSAVKFDFEEIDKLEARVVCEGVPNSILPMKDELGVEIEDSSTYETSGDMCEANDETETEGEVILEITEKVDAESEIETEMKLISEFGKGLEVALEDTVNMEMVASEQYVWESQVGGTKTMIFPANPNRKALTADDVYQLNSGTLLTIMKFDSSQDWGGVVSICVEGETELIKRVECETEPVRKDGEDAYQTYQGVIENAMKFGEKNVLIFDPGGHENQGVYVCHKCGWLFLKLYPSAKHRRAHKKICGNIEEYKLNGGPEDHVAHLNVEDEDCKTPSPNIVNKSIGGKSGVGERSSRSEDDVFSDAVAEFSDSGISPGCEERLDDVKKLEKNVQRNVAIDMGSTRTLEVDANFESTLSEKVKAEFTDHGLDLLSAPVENTEPIGNTVQIERHLVQDMDSCTSSKLSETHDTDRETMEAPHVQSVANVFPVKEHADIMLKDLEDQKMLKSNPPSTLGSVNVKGTLNEDNTYIPEGQIYKPAETLTEYECGKAGHDLSHVSGCAEQMGDNTVFIEMDPTQDADTGNHGYSVDTCDTKRGSMETTHVLSVANDLPIVDHADTMLQDFKDHRTFKCGLPSMDFGNAIRSLEDHNEGISKEENHSTLHLIKPGGAGNSSADVEDVNKDMITLEGPHKDVPGTLKFSVTTGEPLHPTQAEDTGTHGYSVDTCDTKRGTVETMHVISVANDLPIVDDADKMLQDFKDHRMFKHGLPPMDFENAIRSLEDHNEGITKGEKHSTLHLIKPGGAGNFSDDIDDVKEDLITLEGPDEDLASTSNFTVTTVSTSADLATPSTSRCESENIQTNCSLEGGKHDSKASDEVGKITILSEDISNNHQKMAGAEKVITEGDENSKGVTRKEHSVEANSNLVYVDRQNNKGEDVDGTMDLLDEAWIEESTEAAAVGRFSTDTMTILEPEQELPDSNYSASIPDAPVSSTKTSISATILPSHTSPRSFWGNALHEVTVKPESNSESEAVIKCAGEGIVESICSDDVEVAEDNPKKPMMKEPGTFPLHFEMSSGSSPSCKTGDGKDGVSEQMQESDVNLNKKLGGASSFNKSVDSSSQTESIEDKWGSVTGLTPQSSGGTEVQPKTNFEGTDTLVTTNLHQETALEKQDLHNADIFEPPSFMTLVEPTGRSDKKNTTSEIETVQVTQQPESEVVQAGWLPSLTNVVNESTGRKKNEEIITNWSTSKRNSTPLKNLLGDAKVEIRTKSPSPEGNIQKDTTETKSNVSSTTTVKEVLGSEASATADINAKRETAEEWNSPARYPVEIKKERKKAKGKPFWVPFVCCSSVN